MKIRKILALLCVASLITVCGCEKSKETGVKPQIENKVYRNVKVTDFAGEAVLTRDKKQQTVYKQMIINGDDNIVTEGKSTVDLVLDSDKHARIYEKSDVTFKLEGDATKGAIRIYLNKGGINSKIGNKLSADDSYEVHTPDAVMAVRGTSFEVIVTQTGNSRKTEVNTESGNVEITLPNGEQKLTEEGDSTVVESKLDGNGEVVNTEFDEDNSTATNSEPDTTSSVVSSTSSAPKVEKLICPICKTELKKGKTHLLKCGENHYSCDKKDHSVCSECKKRFCNLSMHELLECSKHYSCKSSQKEMVIHSMYCVVCKVYACNSKKEHTWASCGCVSCVGELGGKHTQCDICGRCKSNNKKHSECGFCYGCTGDGEKHGKGICDKWLEASSN